MPALDLPVPMLRFMSVVAWGTAALAAESAEPVAMLSMVGYAMELAATLALRERWSAITGSVPQAAQVDSVSTAAAAVAVAAAVAATTARIHMELAAAAAVPVVAELLRWPMAVAAVVPASVYLRLVQR